MARVRGLDAMKRNFRAIRRVNEGEQLDNIAIYALTPMRDTINRTAPRPSLRGGAAIDRRPGGSRSRRIYWIAFLAGMAMRIAHLVELGTAPHSLAKGASRRYNIFQDRPPFHPGTPPEPFVRPAYDADKDITIQRFGQAWMASITASIRGVKT